MQHSEYRTNAVQLLTSTVCAVTLFVMQAVPILAQGAEEQTDISESLLEIRLARQEGAPGFRRAAVAGSEEVVYVSNEPLVTAEGFEHVEAHVTPNGLLLRAQLKPDVAQRMAAAQRGVVGDCCDRLAILIDGELVNVPRIGVDPNAVANPNIDIVVPASAEDAERIAAAISARWPLREPRATRQSHRRTKLKQRITRHSSAEPSAATPLRVTRSLRSLAPQVP